MSQRPLFKHPEESGSALFEVVNRHGRAGQDIRATTERDKMKEEKGWQSERFFWWRTACNTWQYLVSGPRSPAGSTLFYSIRGAAIRLRAADASGGSEGDTRASLGPLAPSAAPSAPAQICWHAYKSRFPGDNRATARRSAGGHRCPPSPFRLRVCVRATVMAV